MIHCRAQGESCSMKPLLFLSSAARCAAGRCSPDSQNPAEVRRAWLEGLVSTGWERLPALSPCQKRGGFFNAKLQNHNTHFY